MYLPTVGYCNNNMLLYGYGNIIIIWLCNEWSNIFLSPIKNIMSRYNYIQYYQT